MDAVKEALSKGAEILVSFAGPAVPNKGTVSIPAVRLGSDYGSYGDRRSLNSTRDFSHYYQRKAPSAAA